MGHEILGVGRAAQASPDWPGHYLSADVVVADLSPAIREFAPEAVVHAAGTASVAASFTAPLEDLRASLFCWANVLDSVRRAKLAPLVVFPSSAAVYGQTEELPVTEATPLAPISPYGFHKMACELLGQEYAKCFGQRIFTFRLFSVFGEMQKRLLVWELFQQFSGRGEAVWLQGTGTESRDYLHADDMAGAVLEIIEKLGGMSEGGWQVANMASGHELKVLDLAEQMSSLMGSKKSIHCKGVQRPGDPQRWVADISYLRNLAPEWKPKQFTERLSECLQAWQEGLDSRVG